MNDRWRKVKIKQKKESGIKKYLRGRYSHKPHLLSNLRRERELTEGEYDGAVRRRPSRRGDRQKKKSPRAAGSGTKSKGGNENVENKIPPSIAFSIIPSKRYSELI